MYFLSVSHLDIVDGIAAVHGLILATTPYLYKLLKCTFCLSLTLILWMDVQPFMGRFSFWEAPDEKEISACTIGVFAEGHWCTTMPYD